MKKLLFGFVLIVLVFSFHKISSQSSPNEIIGNLSIFEDPTLIQLKKWNQFDPFLSETFDYISNEKAELMGKPKNPFSDSLFVKKFKHITYRTIYDSAKAYRDSVYYKSGDINKFGNIYLWAKEKFPDFVKFQTEYNKYLNKPFSKM